jgi:arginine decarboxylase-like protein
MEMYDLYKSMNVKNFLEYYHDALEHKEELSVVRSRLHQPRGARQG